jgi:dipeptidyl aminopeptidase/acylaminoacyl peptidase
MKSSCVSAVFAAALCLIPGIASARPVAAEDLFKLTFLEQAQISPDGRSIIVVSKHIDGPKNTYETTVLLVDVAGDRVINATKGTHDGDTAWAPDSSGFYFVRAVKKIPQLFRYTLATGKYVQVSHVKDGVSGPTPSHDGKLIAFTVSVTDPAPDARINFRRAGFKPTKDELKSDVRTIDVLNFEANGAGYVYDSHQHIWVMNADGSNAHAITTGHYSEVGELWSASDKTLVFNSLRYDAVDGGPNDIYTVPAAGGAMKKMMSDRPSNNLVFLSRKGDRMIYSAGNVEDPAEYQALRWADFDGSNVKEFVPTNAFSFGDALLGDMKEGGGACGQMLPDEAKAVINADGPGYSNLRLLDLQTGTLTDISPKRGEAFSCSLSDDGKRVAYLYTDALHPADLMVADVSDVGAARQLTHVNAAYLRTTTLSKPQPFIVKDSAGLDVYAWFMPALTGKPGDKHPTLLNIHGGPETQFGDTFFHEFQYLAALGYNVVYSDPRGSIGFGHDFEAALTKSYGDAMFDDVQSVMDAVVKRPDVDASRLGVLGGSYGGYATLWVISHTDRYKVAIADRPVSDLQSENLSSDFASKNGLGGFYQWGNFWDTNNLWASMSPITYAKDVHTPVMILHSSEDTRATVDSSVQEFTLLKILGRKAVYVVVPGENHDLSRTGAPIHRVERLTITTNWLNSYLKP